MDDKKGHTPLRAKKRIYLTSNDILHPQQVILREERLINNYRKIFFIKFLL